MGCGTGQFCNLLALLTDSEITAMDITKKSLDIALEFSSKHNIKNIKFIRDDISNIKSTENKFDLVISNGVLHHTEEPYKSFQNLIKLCKQDGFIIVGLYNKTGRLKNKFLKFLYNIFGNIVLKVDRYYMSIKSESKKNAWLSDQYKNNLEVSYSFKEIVNWFNKNNIEFINSIPYPDIAITNNSNLFRKKDLPGSDILKINEMNMINNNEGGLFILIGKKN